MDWLPIVLDGLGLAGIITGLIEWLRYRKKDKAEAKNTEAEAEKTAVQTALEIIENENGWKREMEKRMERLEAKVSIYQRASNCAYRCKSVANPELECPVLLHLNDYDEFLNKKDIKLDNE